MAVHVAPEQTRLVEPLAAYPALESFCTAEGITVVRRFTGRGIRIKCPVLVWFPGDGKCDALHMATHMTAKGTPPSWNFISAELASFG